MRPRQIQTLKDLKDFITQAESNGMRPDDQFFIRTNDDAGFENLEHPTFVFHPYECYRAPVFVTISFWSSDDLKASARHNDALGTPPHYISE